MLSHSARKGCSWSQSEEIISSKQTDNVIWSAVQRARTVNHELNKILWLENTGLSSSTLNDPHIVRVLNRQVPSALQSTSVPGVKTTPAPLDRLQLVEAEIASVYHTGDTLNRDPIIAWFMLCWTTKRIWILLILLLSRQNYTASPEEYSGSSNLEVYETFIAGILWWLKMNGLLGTKHGRFPSRILGNKTQRRCPWVLYKNCQETWQTN